ncbi:hypothetical protein F0726_01945 [Acidithiobacillus caldus]|nr:hypothetical protein F0726_01945 [Acidithiobacillus caldus]
MFTFPRFWLLRAIRVQHPLALSQARGYGVW